MFIRQLVVVYRNFSNTNEGSVTEYFTVVVSKKIYLPCIIVRRLRVDVRFVPRDTDMTLLVDVSLRLMKMKLCQHDNNNPLFQYDQYKSNYMLVGSCIHKPM